MSATRNSPVVDRGRMGISVAGGELVISSRYCRIEGSNSCASSGDACNASRVDRVEESLAGELALLDATVRSDPSTLGQLLHPDFAELGQSGRWWTREAIINALPSEGDLYAAPEVRDLRADEIAEGVVLVVYVSVRADRVVARSSLWVEHQGRMRIRWHQGTPLPKA